MYHTMMWREMHCDVMLELELLTLCRAVMRDFLEFH